MKICILNNKINVNTVLPNEEFEKIFSGYIIGDDFETDYSINMIPAFIPKKLLPVTSDNYTGFISKEINGSDCLLCYNLGQVLFGINKADEKNYTVLVFVNALEFYKKAIQTILLLNSFDDSFLGFHCVTIEYMGRTIIFSAPSGTGKTTHSELWRRHFGAKIVNGDYAFLKCLPSEIIFEGTIFSGSSEYHEMGSWHVDDIVIIKQSPQNKVERLSGNNAYIKIIENAFVPRWETKKAEIALDMILNIVKNVRIWQLSCTPELESAVILRNTIF